MAQPPTDLGKSLRCCVPCRLIKSFDQFYEQARDSSFLGRMSTHDGIRHGSEKLLAAAAAAATAAAAAAVLRLLALPCRAARTALTSTWRMTGSVCLTAPPLSSRWGLRCWVRHPGCSRALVVASFGTRSESTLGHPAVHSSACPAVQGMVSVVDPSTSWCAKWLRLK